jgi:hypothetical protein
MKQALKKTALALVCAGGMAASLQAEAANWLMLQGTEPASAAGRAKVWGFIQAGYKKDRSDSNSSDQYIPPKLIGPDLTSQSGFNINRARIGVRGQGFPLDGKVNYFFLAEFGNNAITAPGNSFTKITDASITLNHIPGARVRAGLFKTPGSEEIYQGIALFDYIEFTNYTNQQLLERIPNAHYSANHSPITLPADTSDGGLNQFDNSVAAARDTGIQVFDTFKVGNWEHSYAVMIGNGNGLNMGDNDDNKDKYLYWSSELIFAGKGPRVQSLKMFAWNQKGERLLDNTDDSTYNPEKFDRKRSGVGFKYLKKPYRVSGEYSKADGMIWVGPHAPTFDMNPAVPPGNGEKGKANGWYLDFGYYIPKTKWEVDFRYDAYTRLKDDEVLPGGPNAGKSFESVWKTKTLGVQYHFNLKTRLTINHIIRDVEAPDWGGGAGPNANLDGIGNRTALQLTHIF